MVLRCCGTSVVLRYFGTEVFWYCGILVLRYFGSVHERGTQHSRSRTEIEYSPGGDHTKVCVIDTFVQIPLS